MKSKFRNLISGLLKHKLVLFFLVSGINTIFGYGLFALFFYLGFTYSIALLISTIAGIFFNFKTIGNLVFKTHNNILIFKFFGVYGITYLCNVAGLTLLKSFDINTYLSGAITAIPIGFLSFVLNKIFVFNRKKNKDENN